MKTNILFLFAGIILSSCAQNSVQNEPNPKNIVVILSDDHALKVTGTYGNDIIRTPSIDRLAEEGVTFERAYCNSPICSASRQSLLTGKYPHATGVNLLFTPFPDEGNITIAEHLREEGYETALVGKTHWNNWVWSSLYKNGLPDHGFNTIIESGHYKRFIKENPPPPLPDEREYYSRKGLGLWENTAEWMNCNVLPHKIDDAHSSGTFFANEAINFIKSNKDQPFFLWLAFKEPHQPYYFPVEFEGKYNPDEMPLPEGSPEDDRWVPLLHKNLTEEERRGIIAAYYTSTEYMDKNMGLILDALDETGIGENTIIIYISDNGYLLNEHKRFEKHTMWEEATKQPLIIRDGYSFRPGSREDALIGYVDIVPTLLDMAGVPPLETVQGESFSAVVKNEKETHKKYVFSEYLTDNMAMITDGTWKYVFTTGNRDLALGYRTGKGPAGITHRLYNLENDPNEYQNVADEPGNQQILLELQQVMIQKFMETHPEAEHCPTGLTDVGKLVWFCEPRDVGDDQELDENPNRVFPGQGSH